MFQILEIPLLKFGLPSKSFHIRKESCKYWNKIRFWETPLLYGSLSSFLAMIKLFFSFNLPLIWMSFLFHIINTIITSHYNLINIIPTSYKNSTFLNLCGKFIVDKNKRTKGVIYKILFDRFKIVHFSIDNYAI